MALFDKNAIKKLEKEVQAQLDKESKKHTYTSNDSEAEIQRKLNKQLKASGVTPNASAVRKQAKDMHDKLQKDK